MREAPPNTVYTTYAYTQQHFIGAASSHAVATLTNHQQGAHALDHHVVVLRVSSDGLRKMTGIPAADIARKSERLGARVLVRLKRCFLNAGRGMVALEIILRNRNTEDISAL